MRITEKGSVALVVVIILLLSSSLLTLAVAKTRLAEQRMNTSSVWQTRLATAAESTLATAASDLVGANLTWSMDHIEQKRTAVRTNLLADSSIRTRAVLWKHPQLNGPVLIQAQAEKQDDSGQLSMVSQYVLPISVLTPAAELAPPLWVNGCVSVGGSSMEIRPPVSPLAYDGTPATPVSILSPPVSDCTASSTIEMNDGEWSTRAMSNDLWHEALSVTREEFAQMAQIDLDLPEHERIYWMARPQDLVSGRWTRSLGREEHPVVLYVPPESGCPGFTPGLRLYGTLFIDSDCQAVPGQLDLELFGTLIINGDFSGNAGRLRLSHVQHLDEHRLSHEYPVLRVVRIPGTWSDFQ